MPGYYRFEFGAQQNSDITVSYATAPNGPFTQYAEPYWPPNPQNQGSVLRVNANDTVYIQLKGPTGWSLVGELQVIIARASSAPSGQAYSPFVADDVWLHLGGQMTDNVWQAELGTLMLNPGKGKNQKFEITVAFNANLPGVSGPSYFAEDPEMQVDGM